MGFNDLTYDGDDIHYCIDVANNITCKYYDPEHVKCLNTVNNFSFLHLNIRSLNKHHDELASLLSNTGCCFNIIGCSETWLNKKSYIDALNLEGYKLQYKNRLGRPGSGVCLFVRSNMHADVCDLAVNDNHTDSLFVEIKNDKGKNTIVGVIYRPPDSDLNIFNTKLEEILLHLNRTNKDCVLLGDFNIDVSKDDAAKNDFINTLHSSSFFPTINIFTRVTNTSRTIIDNIITNIRNVKLESGALLSDISDHYPIILYLKFDYKCLPSCYPVKTKVVNERTLYQLNVSLQAKVWNTVYLCCDPDTAYNCLVNEITDSIRCFIPSKIVMRSRAEHNAQ